MPQYHYTHLSQKEREQIEEFLGLGLHPSEIANELGRNKSTIYREIKRNGIKNKNRRTRVNKPSSLNVDNRHFRGTIQVNINRKRKEDYRKRLREFEKNKAHYSARKANEKAHRCKSQAMTRAHPFKLKPGYYLTNIVISCLQLRWSPEQISLRLSVLNLFLILLGLPPLLPSISHEAIYAYIYVRPKEEQRELIRLLF